MTVARIFCIVAPYTGDYGSNLWCGAILVCFDEVVEFREGAIPAGEVPFIFGGESSPSAHRGPCFIYFFFDLGGCCVCGLRVEFSVVEVFDR